MHFKGTIWESGTAHLSEDCFWNIGVPGSYDNFAFPKACH